MLSKNTVGGDGIKIGHRSVSVRRSGGTLPIRLEIGPASAQDWHGDDDYEADATKVYRALQNTLPAETWTRLLRMVMEGRMADLRAGFMPLEFEVHAGEAEAWAKAAQGGLGGNVEA